MKPSLFITGAGGFLGNLLTAKLDASKYKTIYCLDMKREDVRLPEPAPENIKVIEGNLLDTSTYEEALKDTDTVIHLAAVTGKVKPKDYFKVNAYGTMLLLDRCKEAGVKNFLFISSIAVSFKNKYRYFYAHSKEQAESYVKTGGLNYTILRPTMIMGKGSPVFKGLAQLTGLPVIPVFGNGKAEIQPIHVEDMAKVIRQVIETSRFHGEVLEIGGPEAISIEEFMKKIARARGKEKPGVFHLPVGLIVFALSILERLVYGLLPLTVGQLASFRNDGTAEENSLTSKMTMLMATIDKIIRSGLEQDDGPDVPEPLKRECDVFTRYLANQKPNNYVLEKYHQCHQKIDLTPADFHDSLLLKLARFRPLFTRMTDAYSRFFRFNSVVRKKLAYLIAILEVTPPYFRFYDSADGAGMLGFLVKVGIKGITLSLHLFISFLFLFPLQVLAKLTKKKPPAPVEERTEETP
jgi:NADH dehydrogenase